VAATSPDFDWPPALKSAARSRLLPKEYKLPQREPFVVEHFNQAARLAAALSYRDQANALATPEEKATVLQAVSSKFNVYPAAVTYTLREWKELDVTEQNRLLLLLGDPILGPTRVDSPARRRNLSSRVRKTGKNLIILGALTFVGNLLIEAGHHADAATRMTTLVHPAAPSAAVGAIADFGIGFLAFVVVMMVLYYILRARVAAGKMNSFQMQDILVRAGATIASIVTGVTLFHFRDPIATTFASLVSFNEMTAFLFTIFCPVVLVALWNGFRSIFDELFKLEGGYDRSSVQNGARLVLPLALIGATCSTLLKPQLLDFIGIHNDSLQAVVAGLLGVAALLTYRVNRGLKTIVSVIVLFLGSHITYSAFGSILNDASRARQLEQTAA